jgi:clan AA aspartic protease
MGKVMTKIRLTNSTDRQNAKSGVIRPEQIRKLEIDALVDTGATMLALPADVVEALGLSEIDRRKVKMANGTIDELAIAGDLLLEIFGRVMACDAFVLPAGTTPLIGQIPLEALDLVVDAKSRELTVHPASPDAPLLDLLRES